MNANNNYTKSTVEKPIRWIPGLVIAILIIFIRYLYPIYQPDATVIGLFGGVLGGLAIIIWWSFFSRAPRSERWIAFIAIVLGLTITFFLVHESIATGGQGMMFPLYAIPVVGLAFAAWSLIRKFFSPRGRIVTMIIAIALSSGFWILLRNDGITGEFAPDLTWRWAKTAEEKLLAEEGTTPMESSVAYIDSEKPAEWPGFRGQDRDGIITGINIWTDWSVQPPEEMWRRPVGPGCSSFGVSGNYLFTQEQRGEDEVVSCYHLLTGEPVWKHYDPARFWDSHAGAGPRSTPAVGKGLVCTVGATGLLNVLDAQDGTVVWSRNIEPDSETKHSGWGYSGSPLILNDILVVAAVGKLMAFDLLTGDPRWSGPDGGDGYSSPHTLSIDGRDQLLLLSAQGLVSLSPEDGSMIWEYDWQGESRILQPAFTTEGDLLIPRGDGAALRRVNIDHSRDPWQFREEWTSTQLKPNFNDFVVHEGYAYGYSGPILVCIDLADGMRKWRGRNYGGQIILLADQDILIILTEQGELAMVHASPDAFTELGKIKAIEGKTWNHPVLVGNILLVRNMQEMVAYKLPLIEG